MKIERAEIEKKTTLSEISTFTWNGKEEKSVRIVICNGCFIPEGILSLVSGNDGGLVFKIHLQNK